MDYLLYIQTGVWLIALFFLYNLWVSRTNNKRNIMEAPEPPGRLSIIGHLHLLRGTESLSQKLGSMADKYGPAFTLWLGARRFLIVSSWEVAKECFTTNDVILAGRPITAAAKYLCYNGAMIGFAPYGPYWRELRKIATLQLLSNSQLETLKHIRTAEIDEYIKELYQLGKATKGGLIKVEMSKWFGDLMFNVVVRMVAGQRYLSTTGAFDDSKGRQISNAMAQFHRLIGELVVSDVFPFLKWMDMFGPVRAMKRAAKELDSVMVMWLEEHRRRRKFDGKAKAKSCFIDVMLSIMEDAKFPEYDSDTIIKATCLSIILGGIHTSAKFLTGALTFLLHNPHMIKKAQDELDTHVGMDRKVDESDIKNLVYVQAVVKETLRICSAGSFTLPHVATQDCTVAGFHVPAGTQVMVNILKVHQDPTMWPNPLEFEPERFLTNHVDVDVRGQYFQLIPFGSGRRVCPGISFALQVMHITLARLIHSFKLEPASEPHSLADTFEGLAVTNPESKPLEVLCTPRLPSKLYE